MRKTFAVLLVSLFVLASLAGCTGNPTPSTGVSAVSLAVARAAGDLGISIALQKRGVSAEDTATIIKQLRAVVDTFLEGKDVRGVLADPILWQNAKAKLVPQLGAVISKGSLYEGVPLVDQASAELLVSALMDAFKTAIQGR